MSSVVLAASVGVAAAVTDADASTNIPPWAGIVLTLAAGPLDRHGG